MLRGSAQYRHLAASAYTGNKMVETFDEKLIDNFFADSNVRRLVTLTATWQPLRICYPREVNVSRFVAWLLDPSQGHGLGDLALQSLLTQAWQNSDAADIPLASRRFLAPSNVQTEGFSAVSVTTEVALGRGFLDVLVVDPSRRRYIAIENKFGARQSDAQLKGYRDKLEKLFPDFLGIHVFLDSSDAEPDDSVWIPVGYDWLAEFLREVEQRTATAEHVRQTLTQFRCVIEDEAEDAMGGSVLGHLVTEVAGSHPNVLGLIAPWAKSSSKSGRAEMLAALMREANTFSGKAMLRLFQLYWRRSDVWDQCIRQVQFASFVSEYRRWFADLLSDPNRASTAFSLNRWESLIDREQFDSWFYPAGVIVRQTGEVFAVTPYLQLNHVKTNKRHFLIEIAEKLRNANGLRRAMHDDQSFIAIKRATDLPKVRAVEEAVTQMRALETALEAIR